MWSRFLRMRSGSVTSSMMRSCPPQRGQVVMSMLKIRLGHCAQEAGRAATRSWGGVMGLCGLARWQLIG
jgi:hypothetical protein